MDAARVLRQARKRAGLTQRALADAAAVPQPQIARIESGAAIPRVDTLDRLLEGCGAGLEALPRPGLGVDRTMYPPLLASSPRKRLSNAAQAAVGLRALMAAAKKEDVAQAFDFLAVLHQLVDSGVRFVVIGSVAASLHGSNIVTREVEICCSWTRPNLERLVMALRSLQGRHRGASTSTVQVGRLERKGRATFETTRGPVHFIAAPLGAVWGYEELERTAELMDLDGFSVRVATLDDLIRMKRAHDRWTDLRVVEELGALRDEIDARAAEERRRRRKD